MLIQKHGYKNNWCHVCGKHSNQMADVCYRDVWSPENVPSEINDKMYIRICRDCACKIMEESSRLDD